MGVRCTEVGGMKYCSDMPVCVCGSTSEHRCCHTLCACVAQLVWPAELLTGRHGAVRALRLAEHVLGPVVWTAPGFSRTFRTSVCCALALCKGLFTRPWLNATTFRLF